jgi:hypothetical protein
MSLTIALVPDEYQHREYETAIKLLRPAIAKSGGRWSVADLLKALAAGRQQLWFAYDEDKNVKAALTTMIQEYPRGKMLEIVFAGGVDAGEWLTESFEVFKRFAKDCGCLGVEGVARKGFEPMFKKAGYKKPQAMYEFIFERKA